MKPPLARSPGEPMNLTVTDAAHSLEKSRETRGVSQDRLLVD